MNRAGGATAKERETSDVSITASLRPAGEEAVIERQTSFGPRRKVWEILFWISPEDRNIRAGGALESTLFIHITHEGKR